MSTSDDRIPVPSNGHRPRDVALPDVPKGDDPAAAVPPGSTAPTKPTAPAPTAPATAPALDDDDLRDPPRIIVTPGQATAVGFGIIAGLILLLLGRRRGRKG